MPRHSFAPAAALILALGACSWGDRIESLEKQQAELRLQQQETSQQLTETQRETSQQLAEQKAFVQDLEQHVTELRDETRGVGTRNVTLRPTAEMATLFGNQSGHNAKVTVSNTGPATPDGGTLRIRTKRIPRPSDALPEYPDASPAELPQDMRETDELDLSQLGASRQLIVPCGFQVESRTSYDVTLNLRIEYDEAACSSE